MYCYFALKFGLLHKGRRQLRGIKNGVLSRVCSPNRDLVTES